jgi:hypothetical protein
MPGWESRDRQARLDEVLIDVSRVDQNGNFVWGSLSEPEHWSKQQLARELRRVMLDYGEEKRRWSVWRDRMGLYAGLVTGLLLAMWLFD